MIEKKQNGRLATAYFLSECNFFDRHLQTFKNATTVYILFFEGFLKTSYPTMISLSYPKEGVSRLLVQTCLSHRTKKFCWGTIQCIKKIRVSKSFFQSEGDITIFCPKSFVSERRNISWLSHSMFQKTRVSKRFLIRSVYHFSPLKIHCLTVPKNL